MKSKLKIFLWTPKQTFKNENLFQVPPFLIAGHILLVALHKLTVLCHKYLSLNTVSWKKLILLHVHLHLVELDSQDEVTLSHLRIIQGIKYAELVNNCSTSLDILNNMFLILKYFTCISSPLNQSVCINDITIHKYIVTVWNKQHCLGNIVKILLH